MQPDRVYPDREMGKTHRGHGRNDFMERTGFEWLLGSVLVVFLFSGCSGTRPPSLGVNRRRIEYIRAEFEAIYPGASRLAVHRVGVGNIKKEVIE
jgi:hypothetical protein